MIEWISGYRQLHDSTVSKFLELSGSVVWLGCLARLAVVSDTRRHSLVFVPSGNNWFSRRDGPIAVMAR